MLLRGDGYAGYFVRAVTSAGMPLDMLRVEVTESALAHDAAVDVLREMRAHGIRVAIDDFGTGWSSLGRLKQLPVDTIKIDRSFVTGLVEDRRDAAIVRSVVALAEELGLRTIAEGVETAAVETALADLGVDRAQGYLYARPLPAAELVTWCGTWRADHPAPPGGRALTSG
jgi:EAL domain-containing protein (putative c-di-GMP-specific phosphodiesterase class I)